MKYIWTLIFIFLSIGLYFYHLAVFDISEFKEKIGFKPNIKNDYMHYYFLVDENPSFVFKKDLLDSYTVWAFENKKNGLIYPHQQTIADLNYISDIQYAGSYNDNYMAKFLYNEINYVTNLSPYWVDIYNFAQIILPFDKTAKISKQKKINNWKKIVKLGEKGILFNCSQKKIDNILSLSIDKYFKYAYSKTGIFYQENKNPCPDYELPDNLAFNYMYYLKDYNNSLKYYKIAAFQDEAPYGIVGMISIINSMAGEHEKAIYMFIERLKGIETKLKDKNITDKKIDNLKSYYEVTLKRLQEEFNLYIISQADKQAKQCDKNYKCLWNKGYIQNVIMKLNNECKNLKGLDKIKSLSDITGLPKNQLKEAKCILLIFGINQGYIQKNKLISPLLKSPYYKYHSDKGWMSYSK